jgi:hypothetical protein
LARREAASWVMEMVSGLDFEVCDMDVLGLMNVKNAIKIIVRVKRFDPNTVASRRKISSFQLFKEYLPQRLSEMALQAYKLSMTLTSSSTLTTPSPAGIKFCPKSTFAGN